MTFAIACPRPVSNVGGEDGIRYWRHRCCGSDSRELNGSSVKTGKTCPPEELCHCHLH